MSFNFMNSIRVRRPKRTSFDLSHEVKLTCDFGELIPFFCQEILPGDTFKVNTEQLVRFAPMIAPIMHRVNVYTHFFFVPYRLIWDDWKEFITGGETGSSTPVFPTFSMDYFPSNSSLADYLGVPTRATGGSADGMAISQLPFRAYQLIYNEYYRDQNLTEEIPVDKSSGLVNFSTKPNLTTLRHRCWEKDYFTSALPFPQRFPNPVTLPIGEMAPVGLNSRAGVAPKFRALVNGTWNNEFEANQTPVFQPNSDNTSKLQASIKGSSGKVQGDVVYDPNGTLYTDLSSATGVSINELRRGMALQSWLERSARGGSRYIEQILSHFGVKSSDARLQRPEYLGGGKTPVVVSEVQQTSHSVTSGDDLSPQGNLAGQGTSYGKSNSFKKWFEEHGLVIGIMSVMPRSSYQNGLPRLYRKFDKFDYYWPEFAHLGEQEIKKYEIFCDFNSQHGEELFGYTPRYAEYRFINSHVHGDMRDSLNFWHLGRIFPSAPGLNSEFVTCGGSGDQDPDTGLNRVFAVEKTNSDHLWVQMYVNCRALRPLPRYGTPGL